MTIPCEICGKPTPYLGTKRCNNCWEVETRLETFLESQRGREFVGDALGISLLDDWKDGIPDAWDYEAVLKKYGVTVTQGDKLADGAGPVTDAMMAGLYGWGFSDTYGYIDIGHTTEVIARKAAALWTALWYRRVSASLCCRLMEGYISHLELQENTRITFLVGADPACCLCFTRENFCTLDPLHAIEHRILEHLGPVAEGEEIICTFTKRKQ
jgi:hypothetical protein